VTQRNKRSAKGELVFTSFLFVAGLIVLWDASRLPELQIADFTGTKLFPSIIGGLLVFLSFVQLILVLRGNVAEPEEIEGGVADGKVHWKPFFLVLGGLLFFALTVKILGFIVSATILFTMVVYALNTKKTRWYVAIPIALAVAGVTYLGFKEGLQVDLPFGFDFNFSPADDVVVEEEW
jgi:putative tricarboxylic transport membrane protein